MKKHLLPLLTLALAVLACNLPFSARTQPTAAPPTAFTQTTAEPPQPEPTLAPSESVPAVTAGGISVTLSSPLSAGFTVEVIPAASDENEFGPWAIAPEHLKIALPNYPLQGKFHKPGIYIYPALSLSLMNEGAAHNIKTLQDGLASRFTAPLSPNDLPGVFFFNAGGLFAANFSPLPFQTGEGARWLTQYAQSFAPVNSHELFYMYQGLAADQAYYVIAILPVTHPSLAADENPNAVIPPGGVPFPEDWDVMSVYYEKVTLLLETAPPDSFTPRLPELDALLSGMKILSAP